MVKPFKINKDIYRDLADFYGEVFHLPPLAAHINSYLIFDFDRTGITFEELVETFSASKSSVSSSINLLLGLNLIKTIKRADERRRYFITNDDFVRIRLQELVERMQREIELLEQLKIFKNTVDEESNQRFMIYRTLLNNSIENIKSSLRQLYNE